MRPTVFLARVGGVFAAVLWMSSCAREAVRTQAKPAVQPVAVRVVDVSAEEWPGIYEATGTVRARTAATLSSKVTGYVQQVAVQAGEHVRAGQLLITLEARELDSAYRRAELGRAEVASAIPEADYSMAAAKASLELAQVTFKRIEELSGKKSVSMQELDEAAARLKGAQANYEAARARRGQLDAKLAQAEQEIRAAAIVRDYARIAAPFSGIVTAKTVDPGNLATTGAPLLTLEQDTAYRLEASVDESRVAAIRLGQAVEVSLDALDRTLNARVSEIVPSVDPAARSYVVKIDLPGIAQLRSGMFGRAGFPLAPREVLTIPQAAAIERGQLQSVFVADNGTARTRLVTLGRRNKGTVEILSGLSDGEKVIVPVPQGLQDGTEVRQ